MWSKVIICGCICCHHYIVLESLNSDSAFFSLCWLVRTHRHCHHSLPALFASSSHISHTSFHLLQSILPFLHLSRSSHSSQHHMMCHHSPRESYSLSEWEHNRPSFAFNSQNDNTLHVHMAEYVLCVCVSDSASDTSVASWMNMDRCAHWSRTARVCGDFDINEIVTKITLSN